MYLLWVSFSPFRCDWALQAMQDLPPPAPAMVLTLPITPPMCIFNKKPPVEHGSQICMYYKPYSCYW